MNGDVINDAADIVVEAVALWLEDVLPKRNLYRRINRETLLLELREGAWRTRVGRVERHRPHARPHSRPAATSTNSFELSDEGTSFAACWGGDKHHVTYSGRDGEQLKKGDLVTIRDAASRRSLRVRLSHIEKPAKDTYVLSFHHVHATGGSCCAAKVS